MTRATLARLRRSIQLGLMLLPAFSALAAPDTLRREVERFAYQQLAGQAGEIRVEVGSVDPGLRLPACQRLQVFLPPGVRLWGSVNVGVRCAAGANWTVYVPVTVRVQLPVVTAARPLPAGRQLTREDLVVQTQEVTELPSGLLTDPAQAVGQTLNVGLLPGYPLRQDMLRAPLVIRQGQIVKLIAQGSGFSVSAEGRALNNASAGQSVQVRTASGQTVSGVARPDGSVEVSY
ncbi:flagellar basal body P-ring formation chaperone FlgA [Thiobacter aerophilum]|uniref:Flagella basal body P-ring formation protein FlgA n=1 Tax=Thiobacter aerophilum TaxID=3121275 RepID=A0ABV0EJK0_9BURK